MSLLRRYGPVFWHTVKGWAVAHTCKCSLCGRMLRKKATLVTKEMFPHVSDIQTAGASALLKQHGCVLLGDPLPQAINVMGLATKGSIVIYCEYCIQSATNLMGPDAITYKKPVHEDDS